LTSEIRWDPAAAAATRDGSDLGTLELSAGDRAAMRVIAHWPALRHLRELGAGRALEQPARKAVAAASALGLLTAPGDGPVSYFLGGRAVQRVWLTASARGLAFQPMTALLYLFARAQEGGEGLAAEERRRLAELRREYLRHFPGAAGRAEVMLFRLARADPPTARSLRRPLDEVFSAS
jgi:hypothetical protein